MSTPYIGYSNTELKDRPVVHIGDTFLCEVCKQRHTLEAGKDEKGNETEILLFYKCKGKSYLAAVNNKLVMGITPSVSGRI